MPPSRGLQSASNGMLATDDENTIFSTAQSRFGQSIGGTPSRQTFQESCIDTHDLPTIAQESSFVDDAAHRRSGLDGHGNLTADSPEQTDSYAFRGNTSRLSGTSQRLSRTAAGGGSSFVASFSRFVCCGAPQSDWDNALAAVAAGPSSPDMARSARFAQLSTAQRSTSAPAHARSAHKPERVSSTPQKPRKYNKAVLPPKEEGILSDRGSEAGDEGWPTVNEGWGSQRSPHSMHRPSSAATVVAPSTPTDQGASPQRSVATGGAQGTPKSSRNSRQGTFESLEASTPPKSVTKASGSGRHFNAQHQDPSKQGSNRYTVSTPDQSPQNVDLRKLSPEQSPNKAVMLSPRGDHANLILNSNPSFKERPPGTPPVPPLATHGSLTEYGRESRNKGKEADDQNVYFFAHGLDPEAETSTLFDGAGASNQMDAILSSTPKALVGVTQYNPLGHDGNGAPVAVPAAVETGDVAQDRHTFVKSSSNVPAAGMQQSGSTHTPRHRSAAPPADLDDAPSSNSTRGTPRSARTPRSAAAAAAAAGGAAGAAAAAVGMPADNGDRFVPSGSSRHPTPPASRAAPKFLQPHSPSNFAGAAVPLLDSAAIKAAESQLAPADTFQSSASGLAPPSGGTFASNNNSSPFQGLEGTADYITAYTAKYGTAPPRTQRSHLPEDDSYMRDNNECEQETSTAFYNESALESSMMHGVHDAHSGIPNDVEEEDSDDDDDGELRKPKGMDPADALDWQLDRLCDKLDAIWMRGEKVLGRYILDGADGRRQGGQAVVQFARNVRDGYPYAIKFYVSKSAFEAEKKLYRHEVLAPMLPHMSECSDGGHVASGGTGQLPTKRHKLPPFIIVEKGEALDEFVQRAQPDMYQSVAILANISKRLVQLHNAGYVHRDLKPSNFLWLPRQNRWTIIDFGSVARMKEAVDMSFSLRYAAPEVVDAVHRGDRKIIPESSQDAWSLGVTAFELLTGKPAFELATDDTQEVLQQLIGDEELPWEGSRGATGKYMRKLRGLRGPVLKLLNRNPRNRPSMSQFCQMCDSIFSTRTDIRTPRESSPPRINAAPAAASSSKRRAARGAAAAAAAPVAHAPAAEASPASAKAVRAAPSGGSGKVRSRKHGAVKSGELSKDSSRVEAIYGSPDASRSLDPEPPKPTPPPATPSGASSRIKSKPHWSTPTKKSQEFQQYASGATPTAAGASNRIVEHNPVEGSALSYDGDAEVSEAPSSNLLFMHSAQRAARRAAKAKSQKKKSDEQSASKPSRESSTPKSLRKSANHAELSPGIGTGKSTQAPKKVTTPQNLQSENPVAAASKPGRSDSLRLLKDAVPFGSKQDVPEDSLLSHASGTAAVGDHALEYTGSKAPVSLGARSERQSTCQSERCSFLRNPSGSNRPVSGGIPTSGPLATHQRDSLSPEKHVMKRAASGASAGGADNTLHSSYNTDVDVGNPGRDKLLMRSMHTRGESSREDTKGLGGSLSRVTDARQDSTHEGHALDGWRSSSVDPYTSSQNDAGLGWLGGAAVGTHGAHAPRRTGTEQENRKRSTRSGGKRHDKAGPQSDAAKSSPDLGAQHAATARSSVNPSSSQRQRGTPRMVSREQQSLYGTLPDESGAQNLSETAPGSAKAKHRTARSNDKEPSTLADDKQAAREARAAARAARAARAAGPSSATPDLRSYRSASHSAKSSQKVSNSGGSGRQHTDVSNKSMRSGSHGHEFSTRSQKSVFIDEMFSLPQASSARPADPQYDDGGPLDTFAESPVGDSSRRMHGGSSRRVHKDRTPSASHNVPSSPSPFSPHHDPQHQGGGQKSPMHGSSRREGNSHGTHASDAQRHRSGGSSKSSARKAQHGTAHSSSGSKGTRHLLAASSAGQNALETAPAMGAKHSRRDSQGRRSPMHAESVPEAFSHSPGGAAVYNTLGNESCQFETATSYQGHNDLEGSQQRQGMESMHSHSRSKRAFTPTSNVGAKISQFETPEGSAVHGHHASHSSAHARKSGGQHAQQARSGVSRSSKGVTPPSSRGSALGDSIMHAYVGQHGVQSQDDNPVLTWMKSRVHGSNATLEADESSMM